MIVVEALLGGPLALVQLHLPAESGLAHSGQDSCDVAVQHELAVVASEEAEGTADHPVVAECPGDVAAGVPEGAQQLDTDERSHRAPYLVEQHDEAAEVDGCLDDRISMSSVVVVVSHRSLQCTLPAVHHDAANAVRYNTRIASAWCRSGPMSSANSSR